MQKGEPMSDLIDRWAAIDAIDRITRTDNWQAAVSMALMDLPSAQPETNCSEFPNNSDTISRQATIDAVKRLSLGETDATKLAMRIGDYLKRMKSAQPDLSEYSDKLWRSAYERGKRDAQAELPIKKKCTVCPHCDNCDVNDDGTITQPQPKTGKWIKPTGMMPPEYMGVYRCSECGEIAMRDWKRHYQTLTNYCPNCGAKMKEGE